MSMDLNFWKYKNDVYLDNGEIYQKACCNGEEVDGLEKLPIESILKKIATVFAEWTDISKYNYEKDGHGAFSIFTTSQVVRIDCHGMSESDINALMDVMFEFGCPLYDPQLSERFDSAF